MLGLKLNHVSKSGVKSVLPVTTPNASISPNQHLQERPAVPNAWTFKLLFEIDISFIIPCCAGRSAEVPVFLTGQQGNQTLATCEINPTELLCMGQWMG